MRTARRGLVQMAAVAVALTVSVAALASVVDGVCQAVCPGDELRRLGRELRADAALEAELRRVLQTQSAKRQVLRELVAGRLTLAAAAERYRLLSDDAGTYPLGAFRKTYAGACDEERWCKCVLQCARMELRDQAEAVCVIDLLEAEFLKLSGDWCDPA